MGLYSLWDVLGWRLLSLHERAVKFQSVEGESPGSFLVLVVIPEADGQGVTGELVAYERLDDFLAEHPEHAFLVHEDTEQSIREAAQARGLADKEQYEKHLRVPSRLDFRVDTRAIGRQKITVSYDSGRFVNISSYEATAKEFVPL